MDCGFARQPCRIQQIEEKSIGASRRLYYVLKPVYHEDSTIFVPVDNPALTGKMHRLLRAQEVLELVSGLAGDDGLWVEDEAQRREAYEQILRSGDRVGMARLIRALSLQKARLGAQHKKLHAAEEAILKEACERGAAIYDRAGIKLPDRFPVVKVEQ